MSLDPCPTWTVVNDSFRGQGTHCVQHPVLELPLLWVESSEPPSKSLTQTCQSTLVPMSLGDRLVGHVSKACPHGHIYCSEEVTAELAVALQSFL